MAGGGNRYMGHSRIKEHPMSLLLPWSVTIAKRERGSVRNRTTTPDINCPARVMGRSRCGSVHLDSSKRNGVGSDWIVIRRVDTLRVRNRAPEVARGKSPRYFSAFSKYRRK